jgi:hypothetical protein
VCKTGVECTRATKEDTFPPPVIEEIWGDIPTKLGLINLRCDSLNGKKMIRN